jgi:hypothetical protein
MRVEILEERLRDTEPETEDTPEIRYDLQKGNIVDVSDERGEYWCSQGWAKDLDGNVETAERRVLNATLAPQNAKHVATERKG